MLLQIVFFVLAAIGVASSFLWSQIVRRWTAGEPILPFRPRERVFWEPVVVLTALIAWVASPILVQGFAEIFEHWQARPRIQQGAVPPEATPAEVADRPAEPHRNVENPEKRQAQVSLRRVQVSCLSNALLLIVILPLLTLQSPEYRLGDYGVTFRDWLSSVVDGSLGFVASALPVFVVLILTHWFRSPETQHPFLRLLEEYPGAQTLFWIALAAVVAAPLAEELVFRVVLQGWLQTRMPPRRAILLVAIFFSAVHPWRDALPLFPLALILGYVYYRRYRFLAVVVLHALFNATNLALALATGEEAPS